MVRRKNTDLIIVHCSATKPDMDIGVAEIDQWHKARNMKKVGYHVIIRRDGSHEFGRDIDEVGAHARGKNSRSIGVCLVGGIGNNAAPQYNFTNKQIATLKFTLLYLKEKYKNAKIIGHNEASVKSCPCFDVQGWLEENYLLPPSRDLIAGSSKSRSGSRGQATG